MTAVRGEARTWRWPRPWLPCAIVGAVFGLLVAEHVASSDLYWAARAGFGILDSGTLPRSDVHSWTAHGHSWTPNSWAWDVVLAALYRLGGFVLWQLLSLVAMIVLFVALGARARRRGARPTATAVALAVAAGGCLVVWCPPRPQLAGYLLFAALLVLVPRALFATGRQAGVWTVAVGGLCVVWVNLHFSAAIAPVTVLAFAAGHAALALSRRWPGSVGAALRSEGQPLVRAVMVAAVAVAGCCATPYGAAAFTKAAEVRAASSGLIVEWRPSGWATTAQATGLVAIGLAVLAAISCWRDGRGGEIGVLAVLAVLTATACRFAPLLAVAALPQLGVAFSRIRPGRRRGYPAIGIATIMVLLTGLVLVQLPSLGSMPNQTASARLVARLPTGCRLLNDYDVGGYVIFKRPDVLVSADSRNDLYGRTLVNRNLDELDDRPGTIARLDRARVGCVLAPSDSKIVSALRASSQWRVEGTDDQRTLLVRA